MRYAYPCVLTPEEGGGFFVRFPDVQGALTCGDNRVEALVRAEDALAVALAGYVQQQRDIPVPSPVKAGQEIVTLPPLVAAKLALYTAMRQQGVTKVALAARLGLSESVVRRLVNLDHRSHISQVEKALRAVGRKLSVEDQAA